MAPKIVVVGSANADLVVAVQRRPGAGETVLGADTVVVPGGKGANTAVAAARLGAPVALLGALGDDQYGTLLRDSLAAAGVATELVRTSARPTGIAYITVTPDGENSIVVSPGANAEVSADDVVAAAGTLRAARVLACSLEVPVPAVEQAVAVAVSAGVRPVLNLSPVARLRQETLASLDPLVVNQHEAAWLLGTAEDAVPGVELASALLGLGPRSVVVTLGAAGAALAERGDVVEVPAPEVRAVDTTGAGDAFTGALAARLAGGEKLAAAVHFAVRVASLSVTRAGAQPSYPAAEDVLLA
ncbi:ribokinase [Gandjariella thermophila]|uniref:Ribokinase n=1 Tax=Gandjariella thermophila TaxID=1931992 RepID=A0A4D4JAE0_9PSEU|nr:ribokinase [Gandjariella thermophila]GDY30907.1 ribokinase [Gandjariella thermophila]